jgi:hypothetical protein
MGVEHRVAAGLTRMQSTERTKDERNERTNFTDLVSLPLYTPMGVIYTRP